MVCNFRRLVRWATVKNQLVSDLNRLVPGKTQDDSFSYVSEKPDNIASTLSFLFGKIRMYLW